MNSGAPAWIKSLAVRWHRLLAVVPWAASLYLAALRWLTKRSSQHFREQILNSLAEVVWPDRLLGPREVTLAVDTKVLLHPHNGEFDFRALLGGPMRYEHEVFQFLDTRLQQYDTVIEIGANVGIFTLFLSKKLQDKGGRVFAFEPSQKVYSRLVRNLAVNGVANVACFGVAIGVETGFTNFYEPEGHLTNGSLVSEFAGCFSDQVRAVTVLVLGAAEVAALVTPEQRVLVKIDVEGFEASVIRALAPLFSKSRPDVLLEVLPEYEEQIEAAVLEAAPGYLRHAITPGGILPQRTLRAMDGRDCFLTPSEKAATP